MFFNTLLKASDEKQMVLKSFNFKVYYTEGGQILAKQIISEAESSLETMENFLGTRLVEQIDIFLSEAPITDDYVVLQRNGNIILENSSIYLNYRGNTKSVLIILKEKLAEILINDMLYGNIIKERLKNNREINVPNWYVSGLAKFVAGGNKPNAGWMSDYYEGKLKLNLNLTDKSELAEFGHAVFIYINDSFGMSKLRQLLFYTKLSGKTDFAFQYVFNKNVRCIVTIKTITNKIIYMIIIGATCVGSIVFTQKDIVNHCQNKTNENISNCIDTFIKAVRDPEKKVKNKTISRGINLYLLLLVNT